MVSVAGTMIGLRIARRILAGVGIKMVTLFSIVATILVAIILVPLAVIALWGAIDFVIDVMIDIGEMWSEWREH